MRIAVFSRQATETAQRSQIEEEALRDSGMLCLSRARVQCGIAGILPQVAPEKRCSLTLDNGRELARPTELEGRLDVRLCFTYPCHAWERGTNENANDLLHQYLPKGADIARVADDQLRSHIRQINHRPRKRLGFRTAFEIFHPEPSG